MLGLSDLKRLSNLNDSMIHIAYDKPVELLQLKTLQFSQKLQTEVKLGEAVKFLVNQLTSLAYIPIGCWQ